MDPDEELRRTRLDDLADYYGVRRSVPQLDRRSGWALVEYDGGYRAEGERRITVWHSADAACEAAGAYNVWEPDVLVDLDEGLFYSLKTVVVCANNRPRTLEALVRRR